MTTASAFAKNACSRALALWTVLFAVAGGAMAEPVDFRRDVRPLLSDRCFKCHGPDEAQRKKDLRLDDPAGLFERGVLIPGEPNKSLLIERISSTDPDFMMPPPDSNLTLSDRERALLRRWIEDGANYDRHWAFQPIQRPPIPAPRDPDDWIRNAVDAFVLKRLQEEGLEPSPEANRETLIRRVSFDLTGLPPTLDEIDRFLADDSSFAYESVVERLLASPAYGERMANAWLDAARYADTYGYQNDRENRVWPWRDWVIRAFNENLPYDEFITQQLAGDLLPDATQDQILATAFNRLHRQTNEGGSVLEEFRVEYVADRTATFGTAFLGLTMECARCHDHKFDPISQKDYYRLFAFFDDVDESGMYSHFTDATPSPSLLVYEADQRKRHTALFDEIAVREQAVAKAVETADDAYREWRATPDREIPALQPTVHLPFDAIEDGKTADLANSNRPVSVGRGVELTDGVSGKAARFSGDDGVDVPDAGRFERTDPFSLALRLYIPNRIEHAVVAHRTRAAEDAANRGWELLIEDGRTVFSLVHFWPGNAVRVRTKKPLALNAWTHLAVTVDGSSRAEGIRIFVNGEQQPLEVVRDNLFKTISYGDEKLALTLGARFRDAGFVDGAIDDFMVFDDRLSELEVEAIATGAELPEFLEQSDDNRERDRQLREFYALRIDPKVAEARQALHQARVREDAFVSGVREIMVMRDMPQPRQAYVLGRGDYRNRVEQVAPGTPESIFAFDESLPPNRFGLAQWLTHPDNPLTARVAVNRIWRLFFGTGLVETQEDFGNQGIPPSHAGLLDYLASEFVASGWDVKNLCTLIATSATYRQNSTASPELWAQDPENKLLARGPRRRLTAEQIRDGALAASGLLARTVGGPSVKPYHPEGLWEDASSQSYTRGSGDDLYRRSMYTFWKRTVPPPAMMAFDTTSREVCVVRREETSTPLQALVLLNDPQFVEAARVLAERAFGHDQLDDRLEMAYRTLLGRKPDDHERRILRSAYGDQLSYFERHPDEAEAYLAVGEAPRNENIPVSEHAALTAVAQGVMNFDEFQMNR